MQIENKEYGIKNYVSFLIEGFSMDFNQWIEESIDFFETINYNLKSISVDVNGNKLYRMSIKKHYEKEPFSNNSQYNIVLYKGEKQNLPSTWNYGVCYNTESNCLLIFFEELQINEDIIILFKRYLSLFLKRMSVSLGYSYESKGQYFYNVDDSKYYNFWQENERKWWRLVCQLKQTYFENLKGLFRYVYQHNILCRDHLNIEINGMLFEQWINEQGYGELELIGNANWWWTIPNDKIKEVGDILWENRLLIAVEKNGALDELLESIEPKSIFDKVTEAPIGITIEAKGNQ